MKNYFAKGLYSLKFNKQYNSTTGLRKAQLGAVYSIGSYFTLHIENAAIIVMPTGSGKTAVLMMTPYLLESKKVLIVTPSTMVRGQIYEDYSKLKTLKKATVFTEKYKSPNIIELKHNYKNEMFDDIKNADVIIATHLVAASMTEVDEISSLFDTVLIDEAHHVPAKTWQRILLNLEHSRKVLFTATPFRLDRKIIKGDIIYSYPLSQAYKDGIFGEIEYLSIDESEDKDLVIAKKAEEVFLNDRKLGYEHYLMVRTNTKKHAKELELLYQEATELKLKRIDSNKSNNAIIKILGELKGKTIDGIICVDMLGEGYDFPNLKIAAVHNPHKSLSTTLQFIGRFARTNAENIGVAKFIAMDDEEIRIESHELFSKDAVWMDMIVDMSEHRISKEQDEKKYFQSFIESQINSIDVEEEIALHIIRPNCHAKVFRVSNFDLEATFPENMNIITIQKNEEDNTLVAVEKEYISPKWSSSKQLSDISYNLYILHYQTDKNLLYIYSQKKTESVYKELLLHFCKDGRNISKSSMHKVLGDLSEFEIFNSGMQNKYVESGESYRISAGQDVSESINPQTGKMYSAGHVFCKAKSASGEITIGYSSGSKMWSSSYMSIPEYVNWCDNNGTKICNEDMKVKTNTNYDLVPIPKPISKYIDSIFYCEYNSITYKTQPLISSLDNVKNYRLTDILPCIKEIEDKNVTFTLEIDNMTQSLNCNVTGEYISVDERLKIVVGNRELSLSDYFNDYPLSFKSTSDELYIGDEWYDGVGDDILFDNKLVVNIDWAELGTDIGNEVDAGGIRASSNSIQATVNKLLFNNPKYKYVIYDHSSGEMADFLAVTEDDTNITIELYHIKKMTSVGYNTSVSDIYEVAGQCIKSTCWFKSKAFFLTKVKARRGSSKCIFVKGEYSSFLEMMKSNKVLRGQIIMVQPSISTDAKMTDKVADLIAATDYYIKNSGKVNGFFVWGSKL